jgi:mannose-6-phosphate isomerase-like protein (cupin superfamily)
MDSAAFALDDLFAALDGTAHDFGEFLRAPTLSLTVALWPAGATDEQQPHTEDEVYYVAGGRARLRVGADQDFEVVSGSVVYVRAGVEHRFHEISEELHVLVFWSPPRSTPGRRIRVAPR